MRKVSVVVPVYNAGELLDRCAPSLVDQSLPTSDYEVIYVDDGSTDDSPARLRRLAQSHPHVRVISQQNSGWPGKPRNVGVAASEADYVQFVDQDDELAPDALARMHAAAVRNDSDVVLGKMGGAMARPNPVFRRSVASARVAEVGAVESLTGHKMFRRAFLEEHALRFPEGYWRMEDLLFVVRVYACDPRVSVVADQTCYWWRARDDGANNSLAAFDVADHYRRLRVVVEAARQAPPGALRDALLSRLYRLETLSRVQERYIFDPARTDWREAFPYLRDVARDCFPTHIRAGLPAVPRLRGLLVEAGEQEAAYELARRVAAITPVIDRSHFEVDDRGSLQATLGFSLQRVTGEPLRLVAGPSGWLLDPDLVSGLPGADGFGAGDPLAESQGVLELEDPVREEWWYPEGSLPATVVASAEDPTQAQVRAAGRLVVDPATAADGGPLAPGRYTIWFSGSLLGVNRRRRIVLPKRYRDEPHGWTLSDRAPLAVRLEAAAPDWRVRLVVRTRQEWLAETLTADAAPAPARRELRLPTPGRLPSAGVDVALTAAGLTFDGSLSSDPTDASAAVLRLPVEVPGLAAGRHPVTVVGAGGPLAELELTPRGALSWAASGSLGGGRGLRGRLSRALRRP